MSELEAALVTATDMSVKFEAEIARLTGADRQVWQALLAAQETLAGAASAEGVAAVSRPLRARRFYRPDRALMGALLKGAEGRFTMADALDGLGWHVREGTAPLARWTGPGPTATIRLPAPPSRRVNLSVQLISVLDWAMVEGVKLTLDRVAPLAPPRQRSPPAAPAAQPRVRAPSALPR